MLLKNGRIYSQEPGYVGATALLLRGATIVAVGTDEEVAGYARPGEPVVDLAGSTVLPGLVDAHLHLHWYAELRHWVNLQNVRSLDEALARVAERAARTPAGEWILGRGWNQNLWPNPVFPTAADLDRAVPNHPVYLAAQSGHAAWVNSLALQLSSVTAGRPDPAGGQILRDAAGQPTGILFEESAVDLVRLTAGEPAPEVAAANLRAALPDFWEVGITGVHCMDGWLGVQAAQLVHQAGELDLRVVKYLPLDHLDEALARGWRSGTGDDWLRIGGLKLYSDGALGVRTAAMLAPFEGEPDNLGILILEPAELEAIARRASAGGLSVAVHAIGDRANRMVIDVLSRLPRPAALPHRVEHVQLLDPADVGRLAAGGLVASVQPIHATSDMEMVDRHWGTRGRLAYAFALLRTLGTHLAFGSDAPVEPFAPLLGIHAAVTRRRLDGSPGPQGWYPEQRLTVAQAINSYTRGAAHAAGMLHKLGTLAPGKLADLVVLDQDILSIDPLAIPATRVLGTMIGGRWVKPL